MNKYAHFEEKSLYKLIVEYSLPATIGMIVSFSYNIIDRIFVGNQLGAEALSGVALTFPLQIIVFGIAFMIGIGANSNVSLSLGRKELDEAEKFLGNAITLSLIFSTAIFVIVNIFFDRLLDLLGSYGSTRVYSAGFLKVAIWGVFFQSISMGLNNLIRAVGYPNTAMFTQIIGAFLNIILDALFIFQFGWGVEGAALATNLSFMISALWVVGFFLFRNVGLKIKIRNLLLYSQNVGKILTNGFPSLITQVSGSFVVLLINHKLVELSGHQGVAILSIIFSIEHFMYVPVIGLSIGLRPIIGYNYGAQNFDRVRKSLEFGTILTTSIGFLGFTIVQLFAEQLIMLFVPNDPELIATGSRAIRVFTFFIYLVGNEIIATTYYQSIGNSKIAGIITLNRQILFLLPLVYILPIMYGIEGVWYAGAISDFASSILSITFIYMAIINLKKKIKLKNETAIQPEN